MLGWIRAYHGKRKSTWYVVIPWQGRKWQFKRDRQGDRFESRVHAQRHLEYLRALIDDHRFDPEDWIEDKPHAIEKLMATYLQDCEQEVDRGHISPSTLAIKRRYQKKYFLLFFSPMDVKRLIALDLYRFYQQLPEYRAKTLLNIMSELNNFLTWCRDQGVIKEIPRFTLIKKLRQEANEQRLPVRKRTHWMREEDYAKIVEALEPPDRPIFQFIRETGCRPSEARALRRSDVDRGASIVEIRRTWVDVGQDERLFESAKSGSNRPIYLTEKIRAILKSASPRLDTDFVFWNPKTGRHYTRSELRHRWKQAVKKAKVAYMPLYRATRSTFAYRKLAEGHSLEAVGAVLGHKHTSTTKRYGKVFLETIRKVMEE